MTRPDHHQDAQDALVEDRSMRPPNAMRATPQRAPCPDCGGRGKIIGTVPGVPASVCTKYVTCERCWPRNDDGTKKFWDDGTAGWVQP